MQTKPWYQSKTLWANAIAILAIILQSVSGKEVINADAQMIILAAINLALRLVTNQPVT